MEDHYEIVNRVLSKYKTLDNPEAITTELREDIEKNYPQYFYDAVVLGYFNEAGKRRDQTAKMVFKRVFQNHLKNMGYFFIVGMAMHQEGMYDLIHCWLAKKEGDKKILHLSDNPEYRHLYHNSVLDIPLIIVGETGTSKELLARTIHLLSNRGEGPFVEINCAAITETLFEAELFGVKKKYPGLNNEEPLVGKIELAHNGTFFLDEIGKMPITTQPKLLKAIEDKKITPLGKGESVNVNVRFIAAVQPGELKNILPDLRYRLGYPNIIVTPTLRERMDLIGDDIIDFSFFNVLRKLNMNEGVIGIDRDVYDFLLKRDYKGNYRELEGILTAVTLSAISNDRKNIRMDDCKIVMDNIGRCEREGSDPIKAESAPPEHEQVSISNIPLKDIIGYSEKVQKEMVEAKIMEILMSGRDIKPTLVSEGMQESEYVSYCNRLKRITGKGIRKYLSDLKRSS